VEGRAAARTKLQKKEMEERIISLTKTQDILNFFRQRWLVLFEV
jgi:hypothetical protein